MRHFTITAAAASIAALTACANFWTIPGEPLTTAELCARAEAPAPRTSPGGVGYSSTYDKDRMTATALYEQAASVEPRFSAGLVGQANSLIRQSNTRGAAEVNPRTGAGADYWTLRCREARDRDERAR